MSGRQQDLAEAPMDVPGSRSQAGRLLRIDTVLGPDVLLLVGLDGEEQISRPFSYVVTMLSKDLNIRPGALIGSNATAFVTRGEGEAVPVNGFIRHFTAGPVDALGLREYRAELVPWLWFLTCTSDCRIYQGLTLPQLLKQVFEAFGLTDHSLQGLTGTYPAIEYCVQYRESAFNFVSRWMEQAGLFYYFRHAAGKHTLVVADRNFQFQAAAEGAPIFAGPDEGGASPSITRWRHEYEFRPGRYAQKDFNFETPSAGLLTTETSLLKVPHADGFELFDYPGGYGRTDHGQSLTRTRIEEEEARYHTVEGDSGCASFHPGHRFTLARHPIAAEAGKAYVLSRVVHTARDTSHLASAAEPSFYRNSFTALPADVRYRAPRQTPCPVVQGPQTAMVVGPKGETIHTDRHGRVKLQFHWDRQGKRDDHSSCWVRVSQAWAGSSWGGVNIPHVGHEVVVSFLEGDPDRPLVTGRVYNGENAKAMAQPANKTQSAMRDHSGNEILMEGKSGTEDIRINATKDTNVVVTHDYNETVKTGNRKIEVKAGTHTETIKGDTTITITTGALLVTVSANTATYTSEKTTKMNSAAADVHVVAKTQIALDVGSSYLLMKQDGTVNLHAKNITIHGSESVRILGDQTVKVSGDSVGVSGGNDAKIGVGGQNTSYDKEKVSTAGSSISSSAVGEHDITGAIVKIN